MVGRRATTSLLLRLTALLGLVVMRAGAGAEAEPGWRAARRARASCKNGDVTLLRDTMRYHEILRDLTRSHAPLRAACP